MKNTYKRDIERAATINELVWIGTTFKQDMSLDCDDLMDLCRLQSQKRHNLEKDGQRYTRAMKPSWM